MAKTKTQKEEAVKELSDTLKSAQTSVFVAFNGIPVEEERAMRAELRKDGVGYKVAKKTLFAKALEGAGYKLDESIGVEADMQLAVAYLRDTDADTIAPAKGVANFIKGHEDNMKILGGIYEGAVMSQADMTELSTIPGLQTLRGMFVKVINSPIQGLAVALGQIAEKKA